MSIDHNIYIGPYIKCPIEMVSRLYEEKGCPKCKEERGHSHFCQTCGTAIGKFSVRKKEPKVDVFEFYEELGENLAYLSVHKFDYYIPNKKMPAIKRKLSPKEGDDSVIPIEAKQVAEEKIIFSEFFAKQIEQIKKAYGSYEIEWGLIQWYS